MPQSNNEADMLLALRALQNDPKLGLRPATRLYQVDYYALRRRQKGIQSRRDTIPNSRRLSDLEEQIIVQFILDQRAKCEDPTIIRDWFRLVENTIAKYGISLADIYNFDETGFMMGVIASGMVITGVEKRGKAKSVQPGNREWVTVIQAINAEGWVIAPFIVVAGQYHLASWYQESNLPGDWAIETTQNGWTDNETGLEWLKHFDQCTKTRSTGRYRLLILDGHESHHSVNFEKYCGENHIITLYGLLSGIYAAHQAAVTESNIKGGFRGAGLVPLDPESVISKLDVQLRTPTPIEEEASLPDLWVPKTPKTVLEATSQSEYLERRIRRHQDSSPASIVNALKSFSKGTKAIMHQIALLKSENQILRQANETLSKRRRAKKSRLRNGGKMTAWCRTPRAAADGSLYSWPDGELVTPDKLAAWLKEDILLRRVAPPQKKPRARGKGKGKGKAVQLRRQLEQEQLEAAALAEAESLAEALEVPLAEAAELLADDREGYVPPTALAPAAADLAEGSLLTRGTIDAYIAAVIELWRLQVAHGNANTENPRGAAVRGFLEQRGRQRGKHDRVSFKDRGTDGIQAGYSPDEWLRVQDLLLSGATYMPQNLRTRVDLLFGHYYLLRGENRRKMELADLSLLDYPSSEGPTPCGCLVTLLRDGKLNKTAKKEFMGALRHKDPLFCTQGALAQLFFWRWHVAGEPSPSFRRRQDWYRIKVLVGRDREQELSYPTQLQETWRIFGAAGLMASKKTHLPRRVGAQDAETHGTSLAQISQAGRWNQSVLCQAYLTHLPRQFMRIVAGFSASPGDYFLARAAHEPPYVLQKQLWPWIEEWEPRFEARARRQCWAEGGLDDDDLAADGFLKLMRRLRVVLLQDLAVLQPRYPSLPFFAYAPFNGPEWDEFAVAVRSDAVGATEPLSLLVQRALPELSGVLESTREAVLQNSQRLAIRLEARLEGIQGGLDALLQGKVPVTFTGHFGAGPAVSLAPSTAPTLNFNTAPAPAPEPPVPGMPVVAALAKVFTVRDVWKEWEEGIAGQPSVRVLEETWGSRWRPGNGIRVQFCRRKVIWDELLARTASGKSEEEAVAELELLRAGRSLNRLVDELKQRRRRGQGQGRIRVQVGTPVPDDPGPGPRPTRGQGHRGRWARLGRRRTAPRRR
ncbi:High-osmolarity-induced transcription protein 1 [Fusarium oxysporum f. sp. cubense]|uniref:High-osmolarity-induced transcription protein 1 n=1 Tax=Fusarium oxysporum f. sp. cubense TaxID=61366 RepID=A0A559KS79_FUSOC|nr:High-osmolarity-induced transcription protein 1 [Fusarium oxysporum f. sp. cubense]